jgi:X-Pro dipeptidyl-peptidase (S15 family)
VTLDRGGRSSRKAAGAPSSTVVRALAAATALVMIAGGCSSSDRTRAAQWPAEPGMGPCAATKQADVPATMRDGTVLRADIYRPQTSDKVPVILMRTQYGKSGAQVDPARYRPPDWFASQCYLVVVQDVRGQGSSGGTFSEFTNDQNDGYDSVEWAAALPGANGKVGMYGSSYAVAGRNHRPAAPRHDRSGQHGVGLLRRLDLRGWRVPARLRSAMGDRLDRQDRRTEPPRHGHRYRADRGCR